MNEEPTTAAIQRCLDALHERTAAEPLIRDLLERAVGRLQLLCATLLRRSYPRLRQPPLNLETYALDALRYLMFKLDAKELARKKWFWQQDKKEASGGETAAEARRNGEKVKKHFISELDGIRSKRRCSPPSYEARRRLDGQER